MAGAQGGDRAALEALLRRHHDRIHALCRRMMRNDADALDATQEALIALVRGLHHFDGRAAFTTWSYRVATNACLDELRKRSRRPDPVETGEDRLGLDGAPMLDDTLSTRLAIDDALGVLTPEYRAAVVLRDKIGLEYAEIADVLGVPVGTVRSRIARGRAALADRLRSASGDDEGAQAGNRGEPPNVAREVP